MQSSRGWVRRRQKHTHASARTTTTTGTLAVQESEEEKKCSGSLVVESGRDWGNRVPPFSRRWQLCLSTMDEPVCHSFLKGGNRILSIYLSIHPSISLSIYLLLLLLLLWMNVNFADIRRWANGDNIHSFIHPFIHPFIHSFILLNHDEKDDIYFGLCWNLRLVYYRVIIIPPKDFWFLFGGFSFGRLL
jgi:hypothetical protein